MNYLAVANIVALAVAQNSIEWSTYSFYSTLAGDYQCLLPWLPDSDAKSIESNPESFIEKLTASPATYYAGLLGLTTGCVWSGASANAASVTATGSANSSDASGSAESGAEPASVSETGAAETSVASANKATAGVAGVGAMAAAFVALL